MDNRLKSVGLDVGTTSTQMIVSELEIQNQASSFAVPKLEITQRKVIYRSSVYFTPLLSEQRVDAQALKELVEREYAAAQLRREDVDTGAVIITGETSRKENARAVLEALSQLAGDFVVATAGPHLESVLAAKGSGAVEYSQKTGETVLHMDIGGGTANLALIRDGEIVSTGCLNVGGRLLKIGKDEVLTYVSPVLKELCTLQAGQRVCREQVEEVAAMLTQVLEMAAGLRQQTQLFSQLTTEGAFMTPPDTPVTLSFSGGVADCIEQEHPWLSFGDMGVILGQQIRKSLLCQGKYRLGNETIRATVIGAGCHSAMLSGSTVYCSALPLPIRNLPVVCLSYEEQRSDSLSQCIREKLQQQDGESVLALPGICAPDYASVKHLAERIVKGMAQQRVLVAVEQDMAKALGQAMALKLPPGSPCLCIDSVKLEQGDYLDVGIPVGPAIPVVVKTLIFET
jgi:ethanolamine utilization protein EutA